MPGKKALAKNEGEVKVLAEKFVDAKGVVIVDYRGMTVEQATKLRSDLRKENVEYKVAKNTLIKLAVGPSKYSDNPSYSVPFIANLIKVFLATLYSIFSFLKSFLKPVTASTEIPL